MSMTIFINLRSLHEIHKMNAKWGGRIYSSLRLNSMNSDGTLRSFYAKDVRYEIMQDRSK
jgi:hypothetical protein